MTVRAELEPLLATQRELYDLPRGRGRFERYLDVMCQGGRDMELPLALMNPMGKPHVVARLDELAAMNAETEARAALERAVRRLAEVDASLRFGLVVVDDAGGGWTHRHSSEMSSRFGRSGELRRGWLTVPIWTGAPTPTPEQLRYETVSALYRAVHRLRHGSPETLEGMMLQEGRAGAFALERRRTADPELEPARRVLLEHRGSRAFPIQFAALYGDEIAESLGYTPLGLPRRAGYRVAIEDAQVAITTPEQALATS